MGEQLFSRSGYHLVIKQSFTKRLWGYVIFTRKAQGVKQFSARQRTEISLIFSGGGFDSEDRIAKTDLESLSKVSFKAKL